MDTINWRYWVLPIETLLDKKPLFCCCTVWSVPSVLWHCWLGGRKGIRPVKNEWWGVGVVVCLERGADLHIAQLMPLPPTVSCFSKIQIGFTFLVPGHLGSPGKRAVKRVCVLYIVLFECCDHTAMNPADALQHIHSLNCKHFPKLISMVVCHDHCEIKCITGPYFSSPGRLLLWSNIGQTTYLVIFLHWHACGFEKGQLNLPLVGQ